MVRFVLGLCGCHAMHLVLGCWVAGGAAAVPVLGQTTRQAEAIRGTPQVDGQIEELWSRAPRMVVRTPVPEATSVDPPSAAWAEVQALWDDRWLYLLFRVHDAKVSTVHGEPWQRDSVEVFLDENHAATTNYQNDDLQYRITAAGDASGGREGMAASSRVGSLEGGYIVELAIGWRTLTPRDGLTLGFEAQVNDDPGTGGRRAIMKWCDPTDRSWQDTSRFGTLTLREQATLPGDPIPDMATVATAPATAATAATSTWSQAQVEQAVPDWVADAVFYQIFPERFRNGDPQNDPTRESLEFPDVAPASWRISPWTGDWYERADWEQQLGPRFYDDGVFHRRYGGDLQGVLDQLDYLKQLGVNTLYFNPVFHARSLHKYDGSSFHHVDPHFGPDPSGDLALMATETADPATWKWTAADRLFLQLIQAAHARQIRLIIDGVFNHTGRDFFAFADLRAKQRDSAYRDWYLVESFDDPATPANEFRYKGWWGVDTLPEFADNADATDLHPGPKAYIFAATRRWMDPDGNGDPADGIDGWRLDVANEVPLAFWRDWNRAVRKLNPQAYTVTELWQEASDFLREGGFSSTMNYHGFAFLVKGFLIDATLPASEFAARFETRQRAYPWRVRLAMQNLIDSHDTDRLASMIVNAPRPYRRPERFDYDVAERASPRHDPEYDIHRPTDQQRDIQRLVALFQLTCIGAPMIYYGTEAGMWGGDDPDDRMPMVWPDLTYSDQTHDPRGRPRRPDAVQFDREMCDYYQRAVRLRQDLTALRRGEFEFVAADDHSHTLAFLRRTDDAWCLVALNRATEASQLTLALDRLKVADPSGLRVVLVSRGSIDDVQMSVNNHVLTIELPSLTGAVLAPRPTNP